MVCPKGHIFETFIGTIRTRMGQGHEICNLCNKYVGSMVEQEVFNYITSIYSGKVSRSNRKLIKPFEIDIVLEDIGICVEFNGDYWHSTKVNDDPDYHWTKSQRCLDVGYKLLQIKENDWYIRNEWVKSNLFDAINNTPISVNENIHILDLSWYDDRFKSSGNWELVGFNDPKLIKVGETIQWDSGQEIWKKIS